MSRRVDTEYISVWDADVIFPINQISKAIEILRTGKADFVYPYDRQFYDTSTILRKLFLQKKDIHFLELN